MIDLNFGDDKQASGFKYSVSQGAPEHGFFISDVFDDIGGDPSCDGEGEVNEQNSSLTKIFVPIIIIEFSDHVLERVK